jgi:hypothetical protein
MADNCCDTHPTHLDVARLRDEFGLPESSDAFTGEEDGPTVEGDPTEYLGHVASWIVDTAMDSHA